MRVVFGTSAALCVSLLVIAGLSVPLPVLAQPDSSDCEGLSGPGAGLCRAAMALECGPGNTDRACAQVSERFESLTGTAAFWLDGQGPEIACSAPVDGGIVDQAPGDLVSLQGSVSDESGVSELLVNGAPVPLDAAGAFMTDVSGNWGLNFVELAATDVAGNQSKRTCTFLVSDAWAPDGDTLSSSISFKARQAVFDDNRRSDPLDSMADIFHTVFNSDGLENELDSALSAANPLKPSACDAEVIVCVLRSEVLYRDIEIGGPNTTSMTLVNGGIRNTTRVENLRFRVRVRGQVSGIPYDTTGWITYSNATVNLISDIGLSGGKPRVRVRPGSVSTSVGSISTSFSGLDGLVINIVVDLFNTTMRNAVRDLVRGYVQDNFNDILDDALSSLDVHNLAANFDIPLLNDASAIGIGFGTALSTLNVSSSRMLATLGTRFQSLPAHMKPTLGAPIPPGNRRLDVSTSRPMAIAVHDGVLNQALHALWSAGYFDASLSDGDLNGYVPPGVSLDLNTALPPAARLRADDRLELALGPVQMQLDHPGLLAQPAEVSVSARGSCAPGLLGDDLTLDMCLVEDLHLSFAGEAPDANTVAGVELFLTDIMNQVIVTVANDALPVLPIPGLILPEELTDLGLPGGSEMRLVNPRLRIVGDHAVLDGNFGVQ